MPLQDRIRAALPCRCDGKSVNESGHYLICPAHYRSAVLQAIQGEVTEDDRERARAILNNTTGVYYHDACYEDAVTSIATQFAKVREQAESDQRTQAKAPARENT